MPALTPRLCTLWCCSWLSVSGLDDIFASSILLWTPVTSSFQGHFYSGSYLTHRGVGSTAVGHQRRNSGSCHGVQVVWWDLPGTGWKRDLSIHQEVVAFFPRTCKESSKLCHNKWGVLCVVTASHADTSCAMWAWLGLSGAGHCQIGIQTGIAVFTQAPATDQRASPTPFPDPWAQFAGVASQAAGSSIPVPPPCGRRGHKSLLVWNHQPVWREHKGDDLPILVWLPFLLS